MARINGIDPASQPSWGTPNGNGFGTGQAHGYARTQSSNPLIDGLRSLGDSAQRVRLRITEGVSNLTGQLRGGHTSWQQPYPGAAQHSGNPGDPPAGGPYTVHYDQTVQPQAASQEVFGSNAQKAMSIGVAAALGSVFLPFALFGFAFNHDAQKNAARFEQIYGPAAPQSSDNTRQNRAAQAAYASPSYIPPMPWGMGMGAGMGPMWTPDGGWIPNMYQSGMPYIPYVSPLWWSQQTNAWNPTTSGQQSAAPQTASATNTGTPRFAHGRGPVASAAATSTPTWKPQADATGKADSQRVRDVVINQVPRDTAATRTAQPDDEDIVDAEIVDDNEHDEPAKSDWRAFFGLGDDAQRAQVDMRYMEMMLQSTGSTHPDAPDMASISAAHEQAMAYFDSRGAA